MVLREEPVDFERCKVDELKRLGKAAVDLFGSSPVPPVIPGFGAVPASHRDLPTRRAELIAFLTGLLSSDDAARRLYASLGEIEQAAVQEAVHHPRGVFDRQRFVAKYGRGPDLGHSQYGYGFGRGDIPRIRLFLPAGSAVPSAARERLAAFVPKPREVAPETTDAPPDVVTDHEAGTSAAVVVCATEDAALRDVQAVLRLVEAGRVRVGSTGRISEAGAKAIREVLSAGDFYAPDIDAAHHVHDYDVRVGPLGIRPFAWAMLLQAGKLARAARGRLELTRDGRNALSASAHLVLGLLWETWIVADVLHELNRVEVVKGQRSAGRPLADPTAGRESIAAGLAGVPQARWITTPAFRRFLTAQGLDLAVVRSPWDLYLEERQYGSLGDDGGEELLDDRFVRAFLLEYAATLGVVDVALTPPWDGPHDFGDLWGGDNLTALSRYDGLHAVRVTTLGAWILGGAQAQYASAPPASAESLRVLPSRDVCALGPSPLPGDVVFLDRIGDRTSERVWRLSQAKILAAAETGAEVDAVREFLATRTSEPLPGTVTDFLDGIAARTRALRDGGAVRVVECRDEALAVLLANEPALRKLCVHGGANRLLVALARESAFRTALRRVGYVLPST